MKREYFVILRPPHQWKKKNRPIAKRKRKVKGTSPSAYARQRLRELMDLEEALEGVQEQQCPLGVCVWLRFWNICPLGPINKMPFGTKIAI